MVARKKKKKITSRKKQKKRVKKKGSKPMSRTLRIYQKIAIGFVILSLVLLLGVLYLSVSHATIRITPQPQVVSTTVAVEVTQNPQYQNQASGYIRQGFYEREKEFTLPEGSGSPVEAKASGIVTLINESPTRADLVATTRLLSEEGILFRLDEAVSIPANGQIEATVSADEPGLGGEIGPTQFTIPGLSAASQEVVYAVSTDSMVGGVQYVRSVTQQDLDQAADTLAEEVLEIAKEDLRTSVPREAVNGEEFRVAIVETSSDTEPGEEDGVFRVRIRAEVTGVFFDKQTILNVIESELYEAVPEGYVLSGGNEGSVQVEVQNVNTTQNTAGLKVYLDGAAVISTNSELLDRGQFLGLPASDVERTLESSAAIKDVSISFTPFWLKRIPTLEDHIKITIESVE